MHKLFWGLIVLGVLHGGCGSQETEEESLFPIQLQLKSQLAETCARADLRYLKKVWEVANPDAIEVQEMTLGDAAAEDCATLYADLAQVLKPCLEDPQLAPYLDIQTVQDTVIAKGKSGGARVKGLQVQKILKSPDGKGLRYIETLIWKKSWLYENQVHVKVYLGDRGQYTGHEMETRMKVGWLGKQFHAKILGQIEQR